MLLDHPGEVICVEEKDQIVAAPGSRSMNHLRGEKTHESQATASGGAAPSQFLEISGRNAGYVGQGSAIPENDLKPIVLDHGHSDRQRPPRFVLVTVLKDVDRSFFHG